jgi:hypothetical protein
MPKFAVGRNDGQIGILQCQRHEPFLAHPAIEIQERLAVPGRRLVALFAALRLEYRPSRSTSTESANGLPRVPAKRLSSTHVLSVAEMPDRSLFVTHRKELC